jgi:uncharacterized protein
MVTLAGAVPDLRALYDALTARVIASAIHGPNHWRRVATTGLHLLDRGADADPTVVFAFALAHDAARRDDGADANHGRRAARLVDELGDAGLLELDTDQAAALRAACAGHADGHVTDEPTVGACWDADRLDLWRLGRQPQPMLLSTAAARDPAAIEWARTMRPAGWDDLWREYRDHVPVGWLP